jgi:hypothetical protein
MLAAGVPGTMLANHSELPWATVRDFSLAWVQVFS